MFTDLLNANIDREKGKINKRGEFETLENKLEEFSQRNINCLYIMGALERDNQIAINDKTEEIIDIGNNECSPMAVTCRSTISRLLGGDKGFKSLMNKAKKFSMKIIIDSLARISSTRFHRFLNFLFSDDIGKYYCIFWTIMERLTYAMELTEFQHLMRILHCLIIVKLKVGICW